MDWTSRAFLYADVEEKGFLTKHQYKVAMTVLFGYCPDKWELKDVFPTDKSNLEQFMNFGKFHKNAKKKMFLLNQEPFDVSYFFSQLDRGCRGYFVLDDLLAVAKDTSFRISSAVLKNAFRELDSRKRGYIEFDDFSDKVSTM